MAKVLPSYNFEHVLRQRDISPNSEVRSLSIASVSNSSIHDEYNGESVQASTLQPSTPLEAAFESSHFSKGSKENLDNSIFGSAGGSACGNASNGGSVQQLPLSSLVKIVKDLKTAEITANISASRLSNSIIQYNLTYRLQVSLMTFSSELVDIYLHKPSNFLTSYVGAINFCNTILDCELQPATATAGFASVLPENHRHLLNSFITLLKTSPGFVATAILEMTPAEMDRFACSKLNDPLEELLFIKRNHQLDLFFHCLFSPLYPDTNRLEYFSSLVSLLLERKRPSDIVSLSIMDKFLDQVGLPLASSIEGVLKAILTKGTFLLDSPEFKDRLSARFSDLSDSFEDSEPDMVRDFFNDASTSIFELLVSPDAGLLPSSICVFFQMVVKKVVPEFKEQALRLIIVKYIFKRFLLRILVKPETLGILSGYHISEPKREKILIPLYQKLCRVAESYRYATKDNVSYFDKYIKTLVDICCMPPPETFCFTSSDGSYSRDDDDDDVSIFAQDDKYYCKDETMLLCPSDVYSLYCALFPSFEKNDLHTDANSLNINDSKRTNQSGPSSSSDLENIVENEELDNRQADVSVDPIYSSAFQWNLHDIKKDLEPVVLLLMDRYPYLKFRSRSLQTLRADKRSQFQAPHPMSDSWQIFCVGEDGIWTDVDSRYFAGTSMSIGTLSNKPSMHSFTGDENTFSFSVTNKNVMASVEGVLEKLITRMVSMEPLQSTMLLSELKGQPSYVINLFSQEIKRNRLRGDIIVSNEYMTGLESLRRFLPSPQSPSYSTVAVTVSNSIVSSLQMQKLQTLTKMRAIQGQCEGRMSPYLVYIDTFKATCGRCLGYLDVLRSKVWYTSEIRQTRLWKRAFEVATALKTGNNNVVAEESTASSAPSGRLRRNSSATSFSFRRFSFVSRNRETLSGRKMSIADGQEIPQSVLNAMFSTQALGGLNKLSDKESESTRRWLEGQHIQNFCGGEELIHRFCCEVDDLVRRVMGDLLQSSHNKGDSLVSSSPLFQHDLWQLIIDTEGVSRSTAPIRAEKISKGLYPASLNNGEVSTGRRASSENLRHGRGNTVASHRRQRSSPNVFDIFSADARKQESDIGTSINDSFATGFTSSFSESESNFTQRRVKAMDAQFGIKKVGSNDPSSVDVKKQRVKDFIMEFQMMFTSLLCSDLGSSYVDGSDTDKWLQAPIVSAILSRDFENSKLLAESVSSKNFVLGELPVTSNTRADCDDIFISHESKPTFSIADNTSSTLALCRANYDESCRLIMEKISLEPSPYEKLKLFHELEMLVVNSMMLCQQQGPLLTPSSTKSHISRSGKGSLSGDLLGSSTPLRRGANNGPGSATKYEFPYRDSGERNVSMAFSIHDSLFMYPRTVANTDAIAEELRRIFKNDKIRSQTLFRDLQLIAALVPSDALDMTDAGKAFWDVGLGALSFKEEVISSLVAFSSEVFQRQTGMIAPSLGSTSTDTMDRTLKTNDETFVSRCGLSDCALLWSIGAKEGNVTSQREIALMHLSHPHLTQVILSPFSKVADIYSSTPEAFSPDNDKNDYNKYNPMRMAVIRHWMSLAAGNGDSIAAEYLLQQDTTSLYI